MRRPVSPALAIALLLALAAPAAAEVTRTLRVELDAPPGEAFAVENLAGHMTVVAGQGERVVAIATVHAASEELASSMRFEQVRHKGVATLRVRYPDESHFRYPRNESSSTLLRMFGGDRTSTTYDGRKVKVSSSSGVLVYADVEVQLPRRGAEATFRNRVGPLEASDVEGKLRFDTGSGDLQLARLAGEVSADTGSGDIDVSDLNGEFHADTGSGDIQIRNARGDVIDCDTGSGDITVSDSFVRMVTFDTGSGHIALVGDGVESFHADTGSGDVTLTTDGGSLQVVDVDTGSGDISLHLGPMASFVLRSQQGNGDLESGYPDAEPILDRRTVVGYRRGDGRTRIDIDTGSGDVTIAQ